MSEKMFRVFRVEFVKMSNQGGTADIVADTEQEAEEIFLKSLENVGPSLIWRWNLCPDITTDFKILETKELMK